MNKVTDSKEGPLAERLKARSDDLGLSQTDLSRRSDVSLSYISRLMRGEIKNPTLDVLRKLSVALQVRMDELAGPNPLPSIDPLLRERSTEPLGDPVPILGRPIDDPRAFFGHTGLIKSLRHLWTSRTMQHAFVSGPAQSGKTSVMMCLKNAASLTPSQWQEAWTLDEKDPSTRALGSTAIAQRWTDGDRPLSFIYASFVDPQLTLSEPRELVVNILEALGLDSSDLPDADNALIVAFMRRVRADLKRRTVWMFDDVDRMLMGGACSERFRQFAPQFLQACHTLGVGERPIGFMMTSTSSLQETVNLQQDPSSPFFGLLGHKFTLGPLDDASARHLVRALLGRVASQRTLETLTDEILEASYRWSYLIQRLCQDYLAAQTTLATDEAHQYAWNAREVIEQDRYAAALLSRDPIRARNGMKRSPASNV